MAVLLALGVVIVVLTAGGLAVMACGVAPRRRAGGARPAVAGLRADAPGPVPQRRPGMPVLACSSAVLALALLVPGATGGEAVATALGGLSLAAMAAVIVVTKVVNEPNSELVATWEPGTVPAGWSRTRASFDRWHGHRTVCAAVSFLSYILGRARRRLRPTATCGAGPILVAVPLTGGTTGGLLLMGVVVARATGTGRSRGRLRLPHRPPARRRAGADPNSIRATKEQP